MRFMQLLTSTTEGLGSIGFPNIGLGDINPTDGFFIPGTNFEIKFYGIIIACGLLLAVFYAMRRAKEFGLTGDDILNVVLIGTPCAIIGARLYYVLTDHTPIDQWLDIRSGGMAIYGGVIGGVLSVAIFCLCSKKRRKKFLPVLDIAGLGFPIGQAIGRWGNFFNREAFGRFAGANNPFAMKIAAHRLGSHGLEHSAAMQELQANISPDGFVLVHPTFLYESVWNAVGFVIIHFLSKKRKFDGQVFLYYLAWYGLGRLWIEGLRMDSLMVGNIRISQLLAGITCLVALAVLVCILLIRRPDGSKMLVNCLAAEAAAAEAAEGSEDSEAAEVTEDAEADEVTEETGSDETDEEDPESDETEKPAEDAQNKKPDDKEDV